MKRFISAILAISLVAALCIFASAASTVTHSLTADGKDDIYVKTGDTITVLYTMSAPTLRLQTAQNEIYYDTGFFELVPDSIKAIAERYNCSEQTKSTGLHYIYFNTLTNRTIHEAGDQIGSFQLKVIGTKGYSVVQNTSVLFYDNSGTLCEEDSKNLTVRIEETTQTKVFPLLYYAGSGGKVVCSTASGTSVEENTSVTLKAEAYSGYKFSKWSDNSTVNPRTVTMTEPVSLTAIFEKQSSTSTTGGVSVAGGITTNQTTTDNKKDISLTGGSQVNVKGTISGSAVSVEEISAVSLASAAAQDKVVSIGAASLGSSVTSAKLTAGTLTNLTQAGVKGVAVKLTNATVTLDSKLISVISENNKGQDITLQVDGNAAAKASMNTAQLSALSTLNSPVAVDAYLLCNGSRISDFGDGAATIAIPCTSKSVKGWYIDDAGTKSEVPVTADGAYASMTVSHFSYYAIERLDATTYDKCAKDATCPLSVFTDVKITDWYHDGVHYCLDNGLMNGTKDTKFAPNDATTRAMIVTILYRMEGSPAVSGSSFSDAPEGKWFAAAVQWASKNGIVTGYSSGKFGPDDPITREQMAAILYRYAGYKNQDRTASGSLSEFPDQNKVSSYAVTALQWAVGRQLLKGNNGKLQPEGKATRAQVATIFQRFCS